MSFGDGAGTGAAAPLRRADPVGSAMVTAHHYTRMSTPRVGPSVARATMSA